MKLRTSKLRHIISEISKNWKDKHWWKGRVIHHIVGRYYKMLPNKGVFVMEEDWDNLIILDACRYDTFVEVTGLNCEYEISRASRTPQFLRENFVGRKFNDTVYITSNPYVDLFCKNCFYKIISVWKFAWNEEFGTVLPRDVAKAALNIGNRYPDKRLIIHFMQPHYPFIKDFDIIHRICDPDDVRDPIKLALSGTPLNPFVEVEKGNLDIETVYKAYKRNLKLVIPYALKLVKKPEGKTVITADYGEAFGEWAFPFLIRIYEHPPYVHIPALVKVPWLVFESKERREIRKGDEKQRLKEKIKRLKD
ncbi:hypothetical protein J7M02_07485 [Candidatus Aerophobetes bacterium]|nr:hypothetical protein [Candidatus Aerophobetes bacterium]